MLASLAKMLGKPEVQVVKFIEQMEDKFCYPSHDVRLLAEINHAVRIKIASLGLDPNDTTARELYHALRAKFAADVAQIDKTLGAGPGTRYEGRLARAIELAKYVTSNSEVWTLKSTVAKNLLLKYPPKKLMKQLHYRSTVSMLKHEDVGELYLLAAYAESNNWQNTFARATTHQASNDYTLNKINFVHPESASWQAMAEPDEPDISNRLTGAVTVWPTKDVTAAPLITLTLILLQGVRQLGVSIDKKALAAVHPALSWWTNMEYLVLAHPSGPISLNLNDVARNHLNSANHKNGTTRHGARALWVELTNRYQSLANEAQQVAETSAERLMPAAHAAEYQEV